MEWGIAVIAWLLSIGLGAAVGSARGSAPEGFGWGFLLGPLGFVLYLIFGRTQRVTRAPGQ